MASISKERLSLKKQFSGELVGGGEVSKGCWEVVLREHQELNKRVGTQPRGDSQRRIIFFQHFK